MTPTEALAAALEAATVAVYTGSSTNVSSGAAFSHHQLTADAPERILTALSQSGWSLVRTEGLDVDRLERAFRDHALDKPPRGWPHMRSDGYPGNGPDYVNGCNDLCATDIAATYAALTEPQP